MAMIGKVKRMYFRQKKSVRENRALVNGRFPATQLTS
jgi:hypothetical protein